MGGHEAPSAVSEPPPIDIAAEPEHFTYTRHDNNGRSETYTATADEVFTNCPIFKELYKNNPEAAITLLHLQSPDKVVPKREHEQQTPKHNKESNVAHKQVEKEKHGRQTAEVNAEKALVTDPVRSTVERTETKQQPVEPAKAPHVEPLKQPLLPEASYTTSNAVAAAKEPTKNEPLLRRVEEQKVAVAVPAEHREYNSPTIPSSATKAPETVLAETDQTAMHIIPEAISRQHEPIIPYTIEEFAAPPTPFGETAGAAEPLALDIPLPLTPTEVQELQLPFPLELADAAAVSTTTNETDELETSPFENKILTVKPNTETQPQPVSGSEEAGLEMPRSAESTLEVQPEQPKQSIDPTIVEETFQQLTALVAAAEIVREASADVFGAEEAASPLAEQATTAEAVTGTIFETAESSRLEPEGPVPLAETTAFETFAAAQPEPEEPVTFAAILEQANEQPLEQTLIQLVELASTIEVSAEEVTPNVEAFLEILQGIEAELPACFAARGNEKALPRITPLMTEKLLLLLQSVGYEHPQEALVRLVAVYDLAFLLQALQHLCQLYHDEYHKEILGAASPVQHSDNAPLRWGKLLLTLLAFYFDSPKLNRWTTIVPLTPAMALQAAYAQQTT